MAAPTRKGFSMSSVVLDALPRNEESVMRYVAHLHVFLHQVMEKSMHHAMQLIKTVMPELRIAHNDK